MAQKLLTVKPASWAKILEKSVIANRLAALNGKDQLHRESVKMREVDIVDESLRTVVVALLYLCSWVRCSLMEVKKSKSI